MATGDADFTLARAHHAEWAARTEVRRLEKRARRVVDIAAANRELRELGRKISAAGRLIAVGQEVNWGRAAAHARRAAYLADGHRAREALPAARERLREARRALADARGTASA